jgi:hypothetical protein
MPTRWLLLALLLFLTACSKTPQEPRYVPVEPGRLPQPPKK